MGGGSTFDYTHSDLLIDENFANFRESGGAIGLHSGGYTKVKRIRFRFFNGRFPCGQIDILIALTDIGPGDGAITVVSGSRKSHFPHSQFEKHRVQKVKGAVELQMAAGNALLFVDAVCHGSAKRIMPGKRRIVIYRQGPLGDTCRHGYAPSPELLERRSLQRRSIAMPRKPIPREPNLLACPRKCGGRSQTPVTLSGTCPAN